MSVLCLNARLRRDHAVDNATRLLQTENVTLPREDLILDPLTRRVYETDRKFGELSRLGNTIIHGRDGTLLVDGPPGGGGTGVRYAVTHGTSDAHDDLIPVFIDLRTGDVHRRDAAVGEVRLDMTGGITRDRKGVARIFGIRG